MVMEERIMFPAALNALRPEDWADIALRWADCYDPFYQPGFEQNSMRINQYPSRSSRTRLDQV